jgi:hypothetical protein
LDEGIGNTLVLVGTRFLVYRRIASLLCRIEGNGSAAWLNCPIYGRITKVPVAAQFSPEDGENAASWYGMVRKFVNIKGDLVAGLDFSR